MPRFSIQEALQYAWQTVRQKLGYFIGLTVVFILVSSILAPFQSYFSDTPIASLIFAILSIALTLIVDLGFIKIVLKTYDGEPTDFPDLFRVYHLSPRYFLSTVIFTLIVVIAIIPGIVATSLIVSSAGADADAVGIAEGVLLAILFLVPLAFASIRCYFFGYFIVDQDAGPAEALLLSYKLTRGQTWPLFLLFLVTLAIVLAGVLALLVGLLVAYPIALHITTYTYRKLLDTQEQ